MNTITGIPFGTVQKTARIAGALYLIYMALRSSDNYLDVLKAVGLSSKCFAQKAMFFTAAISFEPWP